MKLYSYLFCLMMSFSFGACEQVAQTSGQASASDNWVASTRYFFERQGTIRKCYLIARSVIGACDNASETNKMLAVARALLLNYTNPNRTVPTAVPIPSGVELTWELNAFTSGGAASVGTLITRKFLQDNLGISWLSPTKQRKEYLLFGLPYGAALPEAGKAASQGPGLVGVTIAREMSDSFCSAGNREIARADANLESESPEILSELNHIDTTARLAAGEMRGRAGSTLCPWDDSVANESICELKTEGPGEPKSAAAH